ncbi:MAG: cation transporter [Deltaproteobacteria bacterium]|nr:cation transporter [Deltaproteobacteria bacterium]
MTEDARAAAVRKITWWGFAVNIFLSAFKVLAGYYGNSQAVIADGIHSLSDTVTDLAVIAGSYFWSMPADTDHPYGHRRLETIVAVVIGGVLFGAGIGIAWHAASTLDSMGVHPPCPIALVAAGISILVKEFLYRWTISTGRRTKSLSLEANAWHHRLDAISSIPVFLAVGVTFVFPSAFFMDCVAAFFVAGFICYSAVGIMAVGLRELVDAGAPRQTCLEIRDIVLKNTSVIQAHRIRTRYLGNRIQVDLHVVVDGRMTVSEGHAIAEDIKQGILDEGPDVVDVVVHVEPTESALPATECV